MAAAPAALQAQVVYSGTQNLNVSDGVTQQIDFSFTTGSEEKGGDIPDARQESLYFSVTSAAEFKGGEESKGGDYTFRAYSESDGIELLGSSTTPDLLSFGNSISSSDTFFNTAGASDGVLASGSWTEGTTGFLGFRIPATNQVTPSYSYAWVRLNVGSASSFTVVDWAYQDSLGTGITAGAVPEPKTAGLTFAVVALGAVGWRRWRARRPKRHA